jgi:hypothetical protein
MSVRGKLPTPAICVTLAQKESWMRARVAAFVILGLALLGASVHAATEYVTDGTCWLCRLCPF